MNLLENIVDMLGLKDFAYGNGFTLIIINENSAYIQGVKRIEGYTSEKIAVVTKKCKLTVYGKNLCVKKFCMGDMAICGKIEKTEKESY